jgi:hypothetical protein
MSTNTITAEDRLAKLGFHEVDKGGHFAAWEEPELFIVAGSPDSGLLVMTPVLNMIRDWQITHGFNYAYLKGQRRST